MKKDIAFQKLYNYNKSDIAKILNYLDNCSWFSEDVLTKEKAEELIGLIKNFFTNAKLETKEVLVEVKETEEEAREYFGQEFVSAFESLLRKLANEHTQMAIHGTKLDKAKEILESGLKYKCSSIIATAVLQNFGFEKEETMYPDYSGLLNWAHHQHKGLVLVGIPYECYYKEPLWEPFAKDFSGSDFTHRIKPEFIVGYIDVEGKKIILNPNYKREHDYSGLEYDNDIFNKKNITNEEFVTSKLKFAEMLDQREVNSSHESSKDQNRNICFDDVAIAIEEIRGDFRNIYGSASVPLDTLLQLFVEIKMYTQVLNNSIPILKTEAQVRKESEERVLSQLDPNLLNKLMILPNGEKIITKDYLQKFVLPYMPESDFVILRTGAQIPVKQFLTECVMFDCQERYGGDFMKYMEERVATDDGLLQDEKPRIM